MADLTANYFEVWLATQQIWLAMQNSKRSMVHSYIYQIFML